MMLVLFGTIAKAQIGSDFGTKKRKLILIFLGTTTKARIGSDFGTRVDVNQTVQHLCSHFKNKTRCDERGPSEEKIFNGCWMNLSNL